jgi:hypothetical protein
MMLGQDIHLPVDLILGWPNECPSLNISTGAALLASPHMQMIKRGPIAARGSRPKERGFSVAVQSTVYLPSYSVHGKVPI